MEFIPDNRGEDMREGLAGFASAISNRVRRPGYSVFLRKNGVKYALTAAKYILLFDIAFVFLFPFLYMIVTAVKSPADLANSTIQWIPDSIWLDNFVAAGRGLDYGASLKNSIILTFAATAGHILTCSYVGYGFARYRFRGKGVMTFLVILSIIIPAQIIIIPEYIQFSRIGWINTWLPVIVPSFAAFGLRGGLFVYLFKQHYTGLPKELEEAAKIDGCGPLKTFFRMILPISQPPILVTGILSLVWHWNDTFEATIFINKFDLLMVSARLPRLYDVLTTTVTTQDMFYSKLIYNEAVVMAATLLVVLPVLVLYFFLQRWFMEGVERSGIVG